MKLFSRRKSETTPGSQQAGDSVDLHEAKQVLANEDHPDVVHVDVSSLDHETRVMYEEAQRAAAGEIIEEKLRKKPQEFVVRSPFVLGLVGTFGALTAILFGLIIGQLSTIIMYVVGALFIALALDPLVMRIERRRVKRPIAILIVFGGFILIIGGVLAIVIPMLANQIVTLFRTAPKYFVDVQNQEWYKSLEDRFGNLIDFDGLLTQGQQIVADPENWAQLAGGVWQAGTGIANAVTATLIVLILSLYFLASLQATKRAFYRMFAKSNRIRVIDITEQITNSVGGYVTGMVILAFTNSVLGFIMMTIVGVPFAGLVAVGVFMLALIPLIGSVLATILVGIVALFASPTTAIIAVAYYLVYMQIEAYLLTPRIMNRVVSVPGALVVIGALAGGTLLGLVGALISIPVTATILMIIKQVWMPRQESQ